MEDPFIREHIEGKLNEIKLKLILTMRYYANVVYAVIVCLPVCVCVCLSHAGIVSKWLNVGSHKQQHTIAQGL